MVLHRVTLYCMVLHGETGKLGQSDKERTKKSFYLGYFSKPMTPPPQWAKSGGEAVLLEFSDFTKDPMHDFNRLFC